MGELGRHRRAWPLGLLGSLLLVGAVEAMVGLHELDFTTPPRLEWRQSRRASTEMTPGRGILGLGTSMLKLGFFPTVIERESGRPAYNLASCAGRLPGAYFLLRRAIEAGARPEAVVIEVHPSYLAIPYQEGLVAWPDMLGPREALELAWSSRDASFFAETVLSRFLPTLNARAEIRAAVASRFKGEVGSTRPNTTPHLRNLERNEGAFVRRREAPYYGEVTPYLAGMYLNPGWSPNSTNDRYLRKLLGLCESNRIQAFWLIPPMVPELLLRREKLGLEAAYNRYASKILEKFPRVVVIDSRRSSYPPAAFSDAAHLDYGGATTFSAEVGRFLKSSLDGHKKGPRWVDLPPYRSLPTDAPLEEIAQSYKAVGSSLR